MKIQTLKRKIFVGLVVGLCASAVPMSGLTQTQKKTASDAPKNTESWSEKMRSLEKTLQSLLIDLSSDELFNSPKNFKRIEKDAKNFSMLAHGLKMSKASNGGASPDADPSIQIIANQFSSEASRAYKLLASGHRAYARNALKSMTGYCMACHTRNASGPNFQNLSMSPQLQSLPDLEKANFLAATRQFDRALETYEGILSKSSEHQPYDWEKSARSALAIAVRVKKDPDRAMSIVDKLLADQKAPLFIKEQASQWKESLKSWKAEKTNAPQTEEAYFSLAVKLMADAKTLQKYPADRSADILYLRASSAVHDLLSFAPNSPRAADALYLAGLSYEALNDLTLSDSHELYFLECISRAPHTEKARQCFKHYEKSVYFGYSGSGGTILPEEIMDRLRNLDNLSKPKTGEPSSKSQ